MDAAKRAAIEACGRCGLPETAHQHKTGTGEAALDVFAALGGACTRFVASDAAVIYQRHLALADGEPHRGPGKVGKRHPLCTRCSRRHLGDCVIAPGGAPGPDAAARGAAKAREALGITRNDETEAS